MESLESKVAKALLQIKAVFFRPDEPFTWASGIKSPVYCDNRLTLSSPDVRAVIENAFVEIIKTHFQDVEILMGTATAGIPHAAIVSHLMNLPMGYVRSGNKDHGRQNKIEGELKSGQKVLVIEDLISTAGSSLEAAAALKDTGGEVLGIASIFTYNMKTATDRLLDAKLKNVSLTNFDVLGEVAAKEGSIKNEDIVRLKSFRDNPADESWIQKAN
ncbi:MAG: orotate phosphoribosyltransferase [Treponema sp.]|nr:orotate phosphoribosyltransferase [Treponema sp.]